MKRFLLVSSLALAPQRASAEGPLGPDGSAIATSEYSVDLYIGAVLSGNRSIGMGGAYVALAEDLDGNLHNPAAPALRPLYSVDSFEFALGLGLTFPGDSGDDFFNTGRATNLQRSLSTTFFTPALNLQWGTLGFGISVEDQDYAIAPAPEAGAGMASGVYELTVSTTHLQVADSYFDGQLVVGLGTRFVDFSLDRSFGQESTELLFSDGLGLEAGAVWRPHGSRFRLGVAARNAVQTEARFSAGLLPQADGDIVIDTQEGSLYLPKQVSLPWDLNLGVAVQLGSRPFNFKWKSPELLAERSFLKARLRQLDREPQRRRALALAPTAAERDKLQRSMDAEDRLLEKELELIAERAKQRFLESVARMDKSYLLLSASLRVAGPATEAVGVESLFEQVVNRSGRRVVYSPHLGAESAPWPEVVKLRAGAYLEPTRFAASSPRLHGTVGGDLRLFQWNVFGLWPEDFVWALRANLDVAPRFRTTGLTVTGWYPRSHSGAGG